jgi:putative ABC transport system permease protein
MSLIENFMTALRALYANKLRTMLTLLGIVIGIASVIAMVALGEGARQRVNDQMKGLGTNLLYIRPGASSHGHVSMGAGSSIRLAVSDAGAVSRGSDAVGNYSCELSRNAQVKYLEKNSNTSIVGTTLTYPAVRNFNLDKGRFFNVSEFVSRAKVCVLGSQVVVDLFDTEDPMGQTIKINGQNFLVIGVFQRKGQTGYQNQDDQIVIPLSTAQFRLFGVDYITNISVSVEDSKNMEVATIDIERALRRAHRLRSDQANDFSIRNQADVILTAQETNQTLSILLASIAAISLLVGGIGIMNIMIVSVTERTKEIGIRKAIGAKRKDILIQFIMEALVVCILGGVIGIITGIGSSLLLKNYAGWNVVVTLSSVLLSFGLSALVGLFFGFYPALKAARSNVIDSLRYE